MRGLEWRFSVPNATDSGHHWKADPLMKDHRITTAMYRIRREKAQMANDATVLLGIHGLANKPPLPEKQEWWKAAIIEGLQRNCAKSNDDLFFDFVYWADLRYS